MNKKHCKMYVERTTDSRYFYRRIWMMIRNLLSAGLVSGRFRRRERESWENPCDSAALRVRSTIQGVGNEGRRRNRVKLGIKTKRGAGRTRKMRESAGGGPRARWFAGFGDWGGWRCVSRLGLTLGKHRTRRRCLCLRYRCPSLPGLSAARSPYRGGYPVAAGETGLGLVRSALHSPRRYRVSG